MKKALSLLLALCLLLPLFAFAEEQELDIEEIYEDVDLDNTEADLDTGNEDAADQSLGAGEVLTEEQQKELADSLESKDYVPTNLTVDNLYINPNLPDNVINILLLGVDTREAELIDKDIKRADVQMILSYNLDNGSIKLSSILRDTLVTNPFTGKNSAINESYSSYDEKNIFHDNPERSLATVNYNFEMNIPYYVTINFHGVAAIIDSLGGVDIDLTKAEARGINNYLNKTAYTSSKFTYDTRDRTEREDLAVEAGVQHCDGIQALMYARLRKIDNDFARTARQRHLMELLLRQVVSSIDINKLMDLMQTCLPYVLTNMNASTIMNLALTVLGSGIMEKISSGGSLLEQHRVPMDGMYGYLTLDSGASVVNLGEKNWRLNKESIHYFIYGQTYLAQ